ncbi:UDP-N-acetylmuramoyl-tripeptide--D-alanyl-D-alanine ligase [Phormidesmis priestleyi ULC007]|uniref:UDP-N-acetylmuramoyl-tripeptide--D-alanyl-D-alanine ligase n=1 Tax=Phormidesmis priestleyi ULC007 TaxID=1920490 RepID=A0A2T1DJE1_9CYAN|nr:UDP-N-acetylmuramoyl-tripeptide--D-alanyl-D-alanine ligase [Phormidesmis priestleyi]PSB20582.1 UDP-N-acetylmuramoyl-tripeptide--D-alanyl-D-alanine ligase [Phormidesmis priestleyi ULC007]PZO54252.1 MAG: UDP-N-acetylmuramoyl-tripeptide--D-alanyl-D-alanine ligase [Phormidesmis priestleyi]
MSFHATLTQLIDVLGATAENLTEQALTQTAIGITIDSRSLKPGEIFLGLRGEKFDGHDFVSQALKQGAIAAIVDVQFQTSNLPILRVKDALEAYQAIAHWWRNQFKIPVIAITGSVGKTTTKELIAAVLSNYGNVLKTEANYNNEIGVPKTLLELGQTHDYAVVEMGMRARGEIALLSQIASPDIAVITNVGTAHIGRLGSRTAIAEAKCELLAEMPQDAIAILNHDNPLLIQTAQTVWQGQTITYGLEGGDLHGQLIDAETLKVGDRSFPLPLVGQHNALNYLAALAVAKTLNLDESALSAGVDVAIPGGRSRKFELANDIVILDETYNAGLESMLAALQLLADTPGTRHIAVLGTMKELGDWSVPFHQQVGAMAKQLNLDGLLILADQAEAEALTIGADPLPSEQFSTHEAVVARLKELVRSGDRILFKASRSVGLDRAVEQFRSQFQ